MSDVKSAGETDLYVTVLYEADANIAVGTIDVSDIRVTREGSSSALTTQNVALSGSVDASSVLATYLVSAPGGKWSFLDNGKYEVSIADGAVSDVAGAAVEADSESFKVDVPFTSVIDEIIDGDDDDDEDGNDKDEENKSPEAKISSIRDIRSASDANLTVLVEYEDDSGIAESSISPTNLEITGPGGVTLTATSVVQDSSKGGREVTATYTLAPAGGAWDFTDNGEWVAKVQGVTDGQGAAIATATKAFEVKIDPPVQSPPPPVEPPVLPPPAAVPLPPPAANNPGPTVSVAPLAKLTADGVYTVAVTYSDPDGVDANTIFPHDLLIHGPKGTVEASSVDITGPATDRTATYTIAAPGGSWDAADNGSYEVIVKANAVIDYLLTPSSQLKTSFEVDIKSTQPVIDPSFSGGAPVVSAFVAEAAVTLDDGRILLAGRQGDATNGTSLGVLKRLNADGSADSTFGVGGKTSTPASWNAAYYGLTLLSDGTFLVAGSSNGDVIVARYKSNGAIDTKFGQDGVATADLGAANDIALGVAVDLDGRIVVGGGSNGAFAFARFTASGSLDTFFGTRGVSLFALGGGNNIIGGVAVQSDGKIVGVGAVGSDVAVVRLQSNGDADRGFGADGASILTGISARGDLGATDHTMGLALQADGKILMTNRSGADFGVARLNPGGDLDKTFGANGIATIDFGGDDDADAIVAQGTGEILVVGTTTLQGGRIAVAALHADGSLDERFGDNGKITLESGVGDNGRALHAGQLVLRAFATARAGQIVVGSSEGGTNAVSTTGLRRLNVPGSGLLGRFGLVNGKQRTLRVVDNDNTVVTLTLKGGSGQAYYDGTNIDLVLSGTSDVSNLKITTIGGNGRVTLRNVQSDGGLKSITAKTTELSGSFAIGGAVGKLAVRSLAGTVAVSGSIGTLWVGGNVDRATVLAGATLGGDHGLGGTGVNADSFSAASITKINVRGSIQASLFGAGLDRGNSNFLDKDDKVLGGESSAITSVVVGKNVDEETRFVAGKFGTTKIPRLVDVAEDTRFKLL